MPTILASRTNAAPATRSSTEPGNDRFRRSTFTHGPSCSSAELAIAAQAGDGQAAGELYRRVRGRARRAACGFCLDMDADDAVAEGLSRALARIGQLREPAAVEAWMVRSVVRCAIDLSRQRRRWRCIEAGNQLVESLSHTAESAAERALAVLERDSMAQALGDLEPGVRLLLYLRYEAGLSVQHIALSLGRPAGTIRRQCVEARRLARQRFLCRYLRPAAGACAQVTEVLCQEPYRPPANRVRNRTNDHLRRCRACRERQVELAAVLSELGCRTQASSLLTG